MPAATSHWISKNSNVIGKVSLSKLDYAITNKFRQLQVAQYGIYYSTSFKENLNIPSASNM